MLCPAAVERLDDYHCCEHRSKVAALPYGDHPERPYAWREAAVARRFWDDVQEVIWDLQRMQPVDARAADQSDKLIRYLQRHQARLDDRVARKGGDPIGSGGIASANRPASRRRKTLVLFRPCHDEVHRDRPVRRKVMA